MMPSLLIRSKRIGRVYAENHTAIPCALEPPYETVNGCER